MLFNIRVNLFGTAFRFFSLSNFLLSLLFIVIIITPAYGSTGASNKNNSVDNIRIGVILPLTGATAQNGENSLRGVKLAVKQINKAGGIKSMGGAKIRLDIADATSNPAKAALVARRFLSSNSPPLAIIGAYASGLTTTVAQVTERKKIPLITSSFSDALTSKGYKYLFQLTSSASAVGNAQMVYATQIAEALGNPLKKVAIVYADNAYGESQNNALVSKAKSLGLNVVDDISYSPTIANAGPIAQKALVSNPDAIFSIAYVTDSVLFVRALSSKGYAGPIFGGVGGYVTADFGKALGDNVNGIFTVSTSNPGNYGEFGTAFKEKDGATAPQEAHDNAAGVYAIAQALEERPTTNSAELAKTLHSGTFDMGVAGTMPGGEIEWGEDGANTIATPVMLQWQEGKLVGVWPPNITHNKPVWP